MATHPDVAIIGGGIIGLTCAYFLAKVGHTVEVLDRGDLGKEASWAGAGILPPGNPDRAATPADKLRAIGSAAFPAFSAELRELTGIDNGYHRCGGIEFLGPDEADVPGLWEAEGVRYERLAPHDLRRLEPAIGEVTGEPHLLPDCAQVRNPWHLRALIAACERIGVRLRPHEAVRLSWRHGVLLESGGRVEAGCYLIAAGAWSEGLLEVFGLRPGVHPVRGQIVLYRAEPGLLTRVLVFGKEYLVPRADGRVLVGSTEEPEAGFTKVTTTDAVAMLKAMAVQTVPALADAPVEKCWAGLRPGSPDGLPFIGPVLGMESVFVAAGHFRAGVQLSIGTATLVTEMMTGRPTCVPAEAFRVDRVPMAGAKPTFRS